MGSCTSVYVVDERHISGGDGLSSMNGLRKSPPPSILSSGSQKKKHKSRPTASKYIASTVSSHQSEPGKSPPASPAINPSLHPPSSLHVKHNSVDGGSTLSPELARSNSSPKHASRRKSNRSSEGRKVVADANASGMIGNQAHPPVAPLDIQRKPSVPRAASGAGGTIRHHSSRRHTKRRTSNNGMISRLALQFPLIRTSFFAVYRAFARYMKIVKKAEAEVRRKSLVNMHHLTATASSTSLLKQTTESKIDTQLGNVGARGATDIELVEEEGGVVTDVASVTEDEQRQAEIKALLASAPSPLLQEPVLAATSAADPSSTLDRAPSNETQAGEHSRAASVAHASAIQPSVSVLQVRELGTLTPARLGEAIQAISGGMSETGTPGASHAPTVHLTPSEIQTLFSLSDLDNSKSISFREFLVAVALGYFLKEDLKSAQADQQERKQAHQEALAAAAASGGTTTPGQSPQPAVRALSLAAQQQQGARASTESGVNGVAQFPPSPRTLDLHTGQESSSAGGDAKKNTSAGGAPQPIAAWNAPSTSVVSTLSPPLSPQHGSGVGSSGGPNKSASTLAVPTGGNSGRQRKKRGSFSVSTSDGAPATTSYYGSPAVASSSGSSSSSGPIPFVEIQRGFRVVYRAFQDMDADGSGGVDSEELKNALFAATNLKNDQELLEMRFKELDFDASVPTGSERECEICLFLMLISVLCVLVLCSSGEVDLAEFLYAMTSWVGLMDEEDDATDDPTAMIK
jgi:Ca2+-binding EF-hand superfamily protein